MQTETEGAPSPTDTVTEAVPTPIECEGCALVREAGGTTCGDCGTFLSLATPAPDIRPTAEHALEQLVDARPRCLYCPDVIGHFDMLVAWPAADVIAHFDCYAKAQHLVKQTAGVEVRS